MLARALPVLALSCAVLVNAHDHHFAPRQNTATTTTSLSTTTTTSRPQTGTSAPTGTGTGTTTTPGPSGTVTSTTPVVVPSPGPSASDAVPLDRFVPVAIQPTDTTTVAIATPTPGSKPASLPNAPGLPDLSNWAAMQSGYPSPEPTNPIDLNSAQVKAWVEEVKNSGIAIPDIKPYVYNTAGDNCNAPENVARRADWEKDGWWSCGHYVVSTDITECKNPKTWGSSFDDGPSDSTGKLLAWLDKEDISTTFFAVGTAIYWRPWHLQAAYMAGHQIAIHSWNHAPMTTLSTEAIIAQIGWSKKIVKDVIGVTPLYFRPPYGDMDNRVRAICQAMNVTPVMWTVTGTIAEPIAFDTNDFVVPSGLKTAAESWNTFLSLLDAADRYGKGFIVLEHDLYYQQVDLAVGYFLPAAEARGYKIVPIYECAGQELVNAYLETRTKTELPGGSSGGVGGGNNNNGTNGGNNNGGGDFALPAMDAAKVVASMVLAGVLAIAGSL